jgi:ATP-dependent helicase/nuclease subunit A
MKWNLNQQKVIDTRDKNILVSAAAGSGKTAVLVERIITLIRDNEESLESFLIVTFTNAAAAGMKQKIQKALYKALETESNKHIRTQLNQLNKANISTIHSFCIDVLRKNFHVLGIDPNFRIGDPNECQILLTDSIDEVLERAYTEKNDDFVQLVECFTSNRSDSELVDIVKDMYYFIQSFPNPLEWLEKSVDMLKLTKEELENSDWMNLILENVITFLEGARESLEDCKTICKEDGGPLAYIDAILADLDNVEVLKSSLDKSFEDFINNLYSMSHPRLASIRGKAKEELDEQKIEEVKQIRDEYKKIIDSIKKLIQNRSIEEFADDISYMQAPMRALYELVKELCFEFSEKKAEKAIVDFNDVEHFALEALSNEDIAEVYMNKFKFIFVDEYQDSNQIQESLISKIKRENNMFMVGDSKQSIYKFRLADVSLINSKMENYKIDCEHPEEINQRIDLNHNYRSRKEILNATNYIFEKIMSKELGEINYDKSVFLNVGMEFESNAEDFVELNIIDTSLTELNRSANDDTEDFELSNEYEIYKLKYDNQAELDSQDEYSNQGELGMEIEAMGTAEAEAFFAVNKIKELLTQETFHPKTSEFKPIEYKDIVILLRSVSNWSSIFEEIFFNEGIPFYSDTGTGYFETIEIEIMVNFLKLIDNIRQDIPLLSIMRSPIGKFTTQELIEIRIKSPKTAFIDALYLYKNTGTDKLSEKIRNFIDLIEKYKKESRYIKLNDLIWSMLIETDYYYFVAALPNGKMRQANLRLLTDKAHEYEKTSMTGLYNFLRYIDKLKVSKGDEATAKILGENDNVVRLMTIHKSKGLEFPVVILCGLGKKFNMMDVSKNILKHKTYGIAPKYINPKLRIYKETLPRLALKNVTKLESLSEEMRVLYVALTRAVDKLILCATVKGVDKRAKKWKRKTSHFNLYSSNSYLDWICSALYNHKDAQVLRELVGEDNCDIKTDIFESSWHINILSLSDIKFDVKDANINKELKISEIKGFAHQNNSESADEIDRRLSYKYKYQKSVNVPTKLSVTDIKSLNNDTKNIENVKYNIPKLADIPMFKEKSIEFTKAEIGTITHYVMQHLNINVMLNINEITNQVNKMVENMLLSSEEASVVNIKQILDYFESDIGRRMLKSDTIKREIPFVMKKPAKDVIKALSEDDNILIQGIIDCYFYEDDDIVLVDYKTDAVHDNIDLEKSIELIKARYTAQILAYKEALETLTKRRVKEAYLYLFDINMQIKI